MSDSLSLRPGGGRRFHQQDRRGRGRRGILYSPLLPVFRTRREYFDELVVELATEACQFHPEIRKIEFAVEDVPPSNPGYAESKEPVMARMFPANRAARMPARLVIYRMPLQYPSRRTMPLKSLLRQVLEVQLSSYLDCEPEDIFRGQWD